jgi:hypothetical protein
MCCEQWANPRLGAQGSRLKAKKYLSEKMCFLPPKMTEKMYICFKYSSYVQKR